MTPSSSRPLSAILAPLAALLALLAVPLCVLAPPPAMAAELSRTIAAVKPAIVGVGTFQRTRSPAIRFQATGFVVGDGLSVITNAHAIPDTLDVERMETLGVVVGSGQSFQFRPATLAGLDREHDLAHLRLAGAPLPVLAVGDSATLEEGRSLAFTGFPLGMGLGLHHATHRATLAAITPVVMPSTAIRVMNPQNASLASTSVNT